MVMESLSQMVVAAWRERPAPLRYVRESVSEKETREPVLRNEGNVSSTHR